jgi:hypothetical protein
MTRALYRKTGSFSLEEAARIRRAIETTGSAECPACHMALSRIVGENGRGDVWLLQCRGCGRSLVLRDIVSADPALGGPPGAALATP